MKPIRATSDRAAILALTFAVRAPGGRAYRPVLVVAHLGRPSGQRRPMVGVHPRGGLHPGAAVGASPCRLRSALDGASRMDGLAQSLSAACCHS
jgi:hypothetical protein